MTSHAELGQSTRDILFSIPGIFLGDDRFDHAHKALLDVAYAMRGGMLPETLGTNPSNFQIEPALWFVETVRLYLGYGGSQRSLEGKLYESVLEVVRSCAGGTIGLATDSRGFLREPDGSVRAPIQALWHNALMTAAGLAEARGAALLCAELKALAKRVKTRFEADFWDDSKGQCIASLSLDGTIDRTLSPDQLFTVSLGYPMLSRAQTTRLIKSLEQSLRTLLGLREGNAIVPFWLGPFCRAVVYARGSIEEARPETEAILEPLLSRVCIGDVVGDVPKTFTTDAPYVAGAIKSHVPSRAELLRAHDECVVGRGPSPEHVIRPPTLAPLPMRWELDSSNPEDR